MKDFAENAVSFANQEGACYTLNSNMTMERRFTTGGIRLQLKQGLNQADINFLSA